MGTVMTTIEKISLNKWLREVNISCLEDLDFEITGGRNRNKNFTIDELLNFLLDSFEKTTKNKSGDFYLSNLVKSIYLVLYNYFEGFEESIEFNKDQIKRVLTMSSIYEEYCTNIKGVVKSDFIETKIKDIEDVINKYIKPGELETYTEDILKEIKELKIERDELLKKVDDLTSKLAEVSALYEKHKKSTSKKNDKYQSMAYKKNELENDVKKLREQVSSLTAKVNELENELTLKDSTISKLTGEILDLKESAKTNERNRLSAVNEYGYTINKLKTQINELKGTIDKLRLEIEELTKLHTLVEKKDEEIESLNSTISELKSEEAKMLKIVNARKRDDYLDNLVLSCLYNRPVTVNEIIAQCGLENISSKEVYEAISRLKDRYNIENGTIINFQQTYCVAPLDSSRKKLSDKQFNLKLTDYSKPLEILVTADAHNTIMSSWQKRVYNLTHEYCKEHDIHVILDLGDFIDTPSDEINDRYEFSQLLENYLTDYINRLPQSDDILYLMMGGNHEHGFLYCGIDPLERISSSRSDVMSLGYDHAFLNVGKSKIGLHHFKGFDLDLDNNSEVNQRLNDYYDNAGIERQDTYVDLLAHFHRSRINGIDNFAFIPSLFKKINEGAVHLKIYFNSIGEIDYIDFIPLQFKKEVQATTEVLYTKG